MAEAPLDTEEIDHLRRPALAGAAALDHIDAVHTRELLDRALRRESTAVAPVPKSNAVRKGSSVSIDANDRPTEADTTR